MKNVFFSGMLESIIANFLLYKCLLIEGTLEQKLSFRTPEIVWLFQEGSSSTPQLITPHGTSICLTELSFQILNAFFSGGKVWYLLLKKYGVVLQTFLWKEKLIWSHYFPDILNVFFSFMPIVPLAIPVVPCPFCVSPSVTFTIYQAGEYSFLQGVIKGIYKSIRQSWLELSTLYTAFICILFLFNLLLLLFQSFLISQSGIPCDVSQICDGEYIW